MVLPKLPFRKPKTRGEILAAKAEGKIYGWCVRIPPGRPPKSDQKIGLPAKKKKRPAAAAVEPPAAASSLLSPPLQKKTKKTRLNFRNKDSWEVLKLGVMEYARLEDKVDGMFPIALTTLKDNAPKFILKARQYNVTLGCLTYDQFWQDAPSKHPPLLTGEQVTFLQEAILSRDNSNNPMSRHEVVHMISELSQCFDLLKSKNHFDYLIREKRLTQLKRGGRVTTAQATTTKRSAITKEQQWRWHLLYDTTFAELKKLNELDGTGVTFDEVSEHFVGNIDESCFMANQDGSVKVVASAAKRKTEANRDDCRCSITSLRSGNAAGDQGPFIFLAKGKRNECHHSLRYLDRDPVSFTPGSYVAMSENAYMTDAVWLEVVPKLCIGIRQMPVIKEHPNWWCMFSLDGFGSHVNVNEAHKIFEAYKIMVVKEEGDTSQVNQAYDQLTAKEDKRLLNCNLIQVKKTLKDHMSQWHLIKIAANAQMKIKTSVWKNSFIRVNMHPKFRMEFNAWIHKLEEKGIMESGKLFYNNFDCGMYDAMPAFWRRMPVQSREDFVAAVDTMYRTTQEGQSVWSPVNIRMLTKFVPLDDIAKARACYLAAKRDDKAITTTEEEYKEKLHKVQEKGVDDDISTLSSSSPGAAAAAASSPTKLTEVGVDNFFCFKPQQLVLNYIKDDKTRTTNTTAGPLPHATNALFKHMCNYSAQMNWSSDVALLPSEHLDVEVSAEQKRLFNPSYKNVLQGFIMYDVKGAGAKNKVARRRLDILEGNVSSYARCLNDTKRMGALKELNELVASVATISAETDADKQRKKDDAATRAKEKQEKKKQVVAEYETTRAKKLPELEALMEGIDHESEDSMRKLFLALNRRQMLDLLKYYYYEAKVAGVAKLQKDELAEELMRLERLKTTRV